MPWIPPKIDWTPNDYYNFEDLNRVENNAEVIAELIGHFDEKPVLIVNKTRNMKAIEFADSLNRIETNLNLLKTRYEPPGWLPVKTDWKANDPFNYEDAIRLERNLALLHFYYQGNVDAFRHCGAYICGEEVI